MIHLTCFSLSHLLTASPNFREQQFSTLWRMRLHHDWKEFIIWGLSVTRKPPAWPNSQWLTWKDAILVPATQTHCSVPSHAVPRHYHSTYALLAYRHTRLLSRYEWNGNGSGPCFTAVCLAQHCYSHVSLQLCKMLTVAQCPGTLHSLGCQLTLRCWCGIRNGTDLERGRE